MRLMIRPFWLVTVVMFAALALSGCFQDAGGGALQPTQPGGPIVLPPQDTPTPQIEVATPVVPPTLQPTLPLVLPPTTEAPLIPLATNTPPMVVSPVTGPLPGTTPTLGALEIASTQAARNLTATALIAGQGGALVETGPTEVAFVVSETPTPSFTPLGPQGPLAATATAMIITATQGAAEAQTATATALGTYVPSPTPTPTATRDPNLIPEDCVHVVRRGETAYRIARQWGVTLNDISQANGLTNLSLLSIGQQLIIPGCGTTGITPTPAPQPSPTQEGAPAEGGEAPEGRTYLIQPGDNLYRISLRFGVTMRALANANGISNVNLIRAGDTLIIPSR